MSSQRHSRLYSSPSLPIIQGRIEDFQTPPDTEQLPIIHNSRVAITKVFPIEISLSDFLFEYDSLMKLITKFQPIINQHIVDEQNFVNSKVPVLNGMKIRRIEVRQHVFDIVRKLYPYTTNINTENWQSEDIEKLNYIIQYANYLIQFYQEYLKNTE